MTSLAYRCWTPDAEDRRRVRERIVTHEGSKLTWHVEGDRVHLGLPWWQVEEDHLRESDLAREQPTYSRLPIPYTLIPFSVRTRLNRARIAGLRRAEAEGPDPFPADPVETRLDTFRREVWTEASRLAGVPVQVDTERTLVLTHDLDEEYGLAGVEMLRRVERELGVASAVGVLSRRYTVAGSVLEALLDEGCEVFSHGYLHDGLLPFLPPEQLRTRLAHFFEVYPSMAGRVRGFRAGQLVRSAGMFEVVAEFFEYDMTPPTVELGGPHGWRTGCGTTIPFIGPSGLTHLPLTLPQDYFLAFVDRLSADEVADAWTRAAEAVWAAGGVAVHLVHPDNVRRRPALLAAYRTFLERSLDSGATVRLPRDVVMTKRGVSR
ncbi:hypothetical protein [Phycicoccus sp.]|uniref:hypothetical protein n=1 Tax=Phycicoccus sp. TaxID=1902410 RepID=UPI002C1D19E7|nr:hypothetical protein [Phycicoccus sp.]HMM95756.1 hypothetical protein [Phycicoccus sp.]